VHLSIDAADDDPGIAITDEAGTVRGSNIWHTERNHSVELLANVDRMLTEVGTDKDGLTAVFVDIGPGGYAALRVGVSIAKGLAHGLGIPIAGVGRLEIDAFLVREQGSRVVAVHRAGRGEVAWARYALEGDAAPIEISPPGIVKSDLLGEALEPDDTVTGDIDETIRDAVAAAGASVATRAEHRVFALATLGRFRLATGRTEDPRALVPLYLRAPAIGRQP
jgi:tRNA threonylcarbamoyladenosine biosynthesis protein TsaB